MGNALLHRGPNDFGIWADSDASVALGHRRLSILDLSAAGHQPMHSPCGRYVLVYNGEVYNHTELRAELENEGGAFDWRGHSDTETLLAGLRHWGLERCLQKLNGMFAFALWDGGERRLILARDRMGEKPLYYGRIGDTFLFASELKALSAHPSWRGEVNRDALTLLLRHSYIPVPWSIYRGIHKLPPAHFLVVNDRGRSFGNPQCYWDLSRIAEAGAGSQNQNSDALINEMDDLVLNAVGRRMMADVPSGAFLSGGYDSSLVVAAMQAQSNTPIRTFSIGFDEAEYNEAQHAMAVAQHLGTNHTELYVTPKQAMDVIQNLPAIYDEPFADASQIPTFLVSQLARQQVTVSLSGDGGDELFGGYHRYALGHRVWNKLRWLPTPMRHSLILLLRHFPGQTFDRLQLALPSKWQFPNLADRLPKLADVLAVNSGAAFYRSLISNAKEPDKLVVGATEPETILNLPETWPALSDLRERMMYFDQLTYLPDDILTKVDRASMAVSLEARAPLLDHRLVEFAWRVPTEYKFRHGEGKWLLRQVLHRYVPKQLMDRPKMGFGVPIDEWLRGPLRDWAESLLDERRLREEGFFRPLPIRQLWQEHLSGKRRWHYHLWDVLMFQAWNEHRSKP
jgi:asparagine synthase (glutamine-hydrolysing)